MVQRDNDVFEITDEDIAPQKKSGGPLKYILLGCGFFALMFAAALAVVVYRVVTVAKDFINEAEKGVIAVAESSSGATKFRAANSQIVSFDGEVGFGNSEDAIKLARAFSQQIGEAREDLFTQRKKPAKFSLSDGNFLVFCQLDGDRCTFLVHVPDLRKFDKDAKKFLGVLAWATAQGVVRSAELETKPTSLAVGLRGIMLYDRVIIGALATADKDPSEAIIIEEEGDKDKYLLYSFFAPLVEEGMSEDSDAMPEGKSDDSATKSETPEANESPAKNDAPRDPAAEKEKPASEKSADEKAEKEKSE